MPFVDSVSIRDMRGIGALEMRGLARVNVLIGRNNTGKSTILEALTCCLAEVDVRGRSIPAVWREARNEEPEKARTIRVGASAAMVEVHGEGYEVTWELADQQSRRRALKNPDPVGIWLARDAYDRSIESRLWSQTFAKRNDRILLEDLTRLFEMEIDSLQMMPDGALLLGLPSVGLPLDSQGDGVRAAFRMLLVASVTHPGLLVIEEPENHLHSAALRKLAEVLTQASLLRGTQIVLATHSLECVHAFAKAAHPTPEQGRWPFATWALARDGAGRIEYRRLSAETVSGLDETGADVRFLDQYQ